MEATARPWTAHCSHIYAPDGSIICVVSNPGSKGSDYPLVANRDLIVRAVNTFDQARAALKIARETLVHAGFCCGDSCIDEIDQALAAMEAQS